MRHTVTLTYVEPRPEPPLNPLKGRIVPLAVAVAVNYGRALGASAIRLRNPDTNLIGYYCDVLGFDLAHEGGGRVFCVKEI